MWSDFGFLRLRCSGCVGGDGWILLESGAWLFWVFRSRCVGGSGLSVAMLLEGGWGGSEKETREAGVLRLECSSPQEAARV